MTYYAPCTILGLLGYSNEQNLVLMEFVFLSDRARWIKAIYIICKSIHKPVVVMHACNPRE
jgi:hypothetical protein